MGRRSNTEARRPGNVGEAQLHGSGNVDHIVAHITMVDDLLLAGAGASLRLRGLFSQLLDDLGPENIDAGAEINKVGTRGLPFDKLCFSLGVFPGAVRINRFGTPADEFFEKGVVAGVATFLRIGFCLV